MPHQRREPTRTCVGCREEAGKQQLIRVVRKAEGGAEIDLTGRATGRGAYLHDNPSCMETARKKHSLDRALRTTIESEFWTELIR